MKIHFKKTPVYFLAVSVVVGEVATNRELDKWWGRKEQEERQLPGSTSRVPYSAVSLNVNLQPLPSGTEALPLSQPRSVSWVAQAYLGGFASPDPPTQIVDQPHKTLLETHSETFLWHIRCPIPCYSSSDILLPLGGCHASPSCNLGSPPISKLSS